MNERELFEKWFADEQRQWIGPPKAVAWEAWQAARAAVPAERPTKGDPMLDAVLKTDNPEFHEWVESLPQQYWARYDLSACRIGWEAKAARAAAPAKASGIVIPPPGEGSCGYTGPSAAAPANIRERWNIERDGDDLLVCFNLHGKGEKCEYERFTRAAAPVRDEAYIARAMELADEYADDVRELAEAAGNPKKEERERKHVADTRAALLAHLKGEA